MFRAIPIGNKICHERVHKRYEAERAQRLREMKPQIDARAPEVCGMKHLKVNYKRNEVLGVRYDQIEHDNRKLLQVMSRIAQEPGLGKSAKSPNHSRSAPNLGQGGKDAAFPGGPARRREISRIEAENALLLKRLQTCKAEYKTKEWEASHDESRKILRRICEYPVRDTGVKRRVRPAASLEQLGRDDMASPAGMDPGAFASDSASPSTQGLRYVFKEHLLIDGASFFVEMATDGQTLAVSAFDREIQDTLELLVNQENHRKLLLESGNDYGRIAGRLRIRDDQLIIISQEAQDEAEGRIQR